MKEKNSIWKKILNYIKNIFSSNQKLLNENVEFNFDVYNDFVKRYIDKK